MNQSAREVSDFHVALQTEKKKWNQSQTSMIFYNLLTSSGAHSADHCVRIVWLKIARPCWIYFANATLALREMQIKNV